MKYVLLLSDSLLEESILDRKWYSHKAIGILTIDFSPVHVIKLKQDFQDKTVLIIIELLIFLFDRPSQCWGISNFLTLSGIHLYNFSNFYNANEAFKVYNESPTGYLIILYFNISVLTQVNILLSFSLQKTSNKKGTGQRQRQTLQSHDPRNLTGSYLLQFYHFPTIQN